MNYNNILWGVEKTNVFNDTINFSSYDGDSQTKYKVIMQTMK